MSYWLLITLLQSKPEQSECLQGERYGVRRMSAQAFDFNSDLFNPSGNSNGAICVGHPWKPAHQLPLNCLWFQHQEDITPGFNICLWIESDYVPLACDLALQRVHPSTWVSSECVLVSLYGAHMPTVYTCLDFPHHMHSARSCMSGEGSSGNLCCMSQVV